MSVALQTEAIPEPIAEPALLASPNLLFRKCACGGPAGMNDDCPDCSGKRLSVQRKVSRPGDALELEADRLAEQVMRSLGPTSRPQASSSGAPAIPASGASDLANVAIFRQACEPEKPEPAASAPKTSAQQTPAASTATPATSKSASAGLIVEDNGAQIAPGQMRKTQFLDELKASVCAAADAELAAVGRSAKGCPYIENWINHYRSKDSGHVERALHKFAPEAAGITSARDYIPIVSNRIRRSVSVWATTGKITGMPEELAGEIPGGGLLGAIGGLISGIGSALSGLVSGIGSAVSSIASGAGKAVGSLSFKAREGGPNEADPEQIRSRLGHGQPLDAGVKLRMESAFGHDFSGVRIHNDAGAGNLSASLNARAFTLGGHVAFGSGEYRPGTIVGDALIAHELAHVVQQGDAHPAGESMRKGEGEQGSLEEDADRSVVGAILALWGGTAGGLVSPGRSAAPRLRSGLNLSRCNNQTPAVDGACKPKLISMEAKKGDIVMTTDFTNRCHLSFGTADKLGMSFESKVEIPSGCPGTLYYVQLIDRNLNKIDSCGKPCADKTNGFTLDTGDPYKMKRVDPGTVTIDANDNPGADSIGWNQLDITDRFQMYLLWKPDEPANAARVPLERIDWFWTAKATRKGQTGDCQADWQISGAQADAGTMMQATELPPLTKSDKKACQPSTCSAPGTPPIQRSPMKNDTSLRQAAAPAGLEPQPTATTATAQQSQAPAPPASTPQPGSGGLIVEDAAAGQIAPGQMRKSQFLDELKSNVCAAADEELAAVGRSAQGCPYIEKWIGHYRTKDSHYVERSLHKFAPEAAGITSARDYIPIVSNRIRRSVSVWATTGKITGVPEELASEIPGGGLLGAIGGLISGIGSAVSGLVSGIGSAVSGIASGIGKAVGSLFFKSREGGAKEGDPEQVRSQLGPGQPLESAVKSRMEPAFGHDFSRVRIHTDANAEQLSLALNARAFTVGHHIAFGRAEYDPLTLPGNALIAHELAHVVQQGNSSANNNPRKQSAHESDSLEDEADVAAANALFAVSGFRKSEEYIKTKAFPRMKSGIALQRCHDKESAKATSCQTYDNADCAKTEATVPCCPQSHFTDAQSKAGSLLQKAAKALSTPDANVNGALDSRFGSQDSNRKQVADDVKANLSAAEAHIAKQMTPAGKPAGANGTTKVPGHVCATKCDPLCQESTDAYTDGTDGDALVTLCYGSSGFMKQPDVNVRAGTLIHEAIHGITLQAGSAGMKPAESPSGVDFAYAQQREFPLLDPKTAIQNPDSYMLFVQQINGQQVSVGPKRADIYSDDMSPCEREETNRALAWAESEALAAQQGMMQWHSWISRSIAAKSWLKDSASDMSQAVSNVGLGPANGPQSTDEKNAQQVDRIFLTLRDTLYGRSVKIKKVQRGTTFWSKSDGQFTVGPDFFAPTGSGKTAAQSAILLRGILETIDEVVLSDNPDLRQSANERVRNYLDLIDSIRVKRGLGNPPDKECK
jgi:hypothetical protein